MAYHVFVNGIGWRICDVLLLLLLPLLVLVLAVIHGKARWTRYGYGCFEYGIQ